MKDSLLYIIFGASGDLTRRKLVPALYSLFVQQLLPEHFSLLGVSRSAISDADFREQMRRGIADFREIDDTTSIDEFVSCFHYQSIQFDDETTYKALVTRINEIRETRQIGGNTLFYLSTPPSLYGIIPKHLASVGLHKQSDGWKRLIIEKPFGYDLESAIELRDALMSHWQENQLYRIDHYLGKETVQNLLVTRFSNGIFEPLWNRNYIHHVEITSAESIGVEKRGGYYETSGALRDMVQNHLLQVAAITAMEPPGSLAPDAIRNEILKVFQSFRPIDPLTIATCSIRGQYLQSTVKGEKLNGYREEEGVDSQSVTETYVALKFYIDNWRWGGVPFYIRTGKRLPTRVTEVVIHFNPTPHFLFSRGEMKSDSCNQLVIRIQPDEGILLKFGMKIPGSGFDVQTVNMDFHYADLTHQRIPSAYERLIYDAIKGDSTLFARTEEVIAAWKFLDPVLKGWQHNAIPLFGYPAGTWGPESADNLIEGKNVTWRYPCKNLSDDGIYCEL